MTKNKISVIREDGDYLIIAGSFKDVIFGKNEKKSINVNGLIKINKNTTSNTISDVVVKSFLGMEGNEWFTGFNHRKEIGSLEGGMSTPYLSPIIDTTENGIQIPYEFSIKDILIKGNFMIICGTFVTYRCKSISHNKKEADHNIENVYMVGRYSLIVIDKTTGEFLNKGIIFDIPEDGSSAILSNGGYEEKFDISINTLEDYDSNKIIVGGNFNQYKVIDTTPVSGYYESNFGNSSSILVYDIVNNTVDTTFIPTNNSNYNKYYDPLYSWDYNIDINKGIPSRGFFSDYGQNSQNASYPGINTTKLSRGVKKITKITINNQDKFVVGGYFNCYMDGVKKHWYNKIIILNSDGSVYTNFLEANNTIYDQTKYNQFDDFIINDSNHGDGFSYLGINNYIDTDIRKASDGTPFVYNSTQLLFADDEDLMAINAIRVKSYVNEIVPQILNGEEYLLVGGRFNFFKEGSNVYEVKNIVRFKKNSSDKYVFDTTFEYDNPDMKLYEVTTIKIVPGGILVGGVYDTSDNTEKSISDDYTDTLKNISKKVSSGPIILLKSDGQSNNSVSKSLSFRFYENNNSSIPPMVSKII